MLGQREVILVGLGKFGKSVSETLKNMIEERRVQLGKNASSVILYTVNFSDDNIFHSSEYMNEILEAVKDSSARKNGEKFSFIFVGDLAENGTSKYAVDFAYLPFLIKQRGISLDFEEVLGFFTFADELGTTEQVSDETIALIRNHFRNLEQVNKKDLYEVPFKDAKGKPFKNVDTSAGPFNRNYILVTPGKSVAVAKETGIVFAERIFYELFYLEKNLSEQSRNWAASVNDKENSKKNLSCFSMVQIPRINEVQKYYLKYLLEEKIISSFLAEPLKGTDEQYFFAKFLDMIDVPSNSDEFPIERAAGLFIDRYKENFSHLISFYIADKKEDFTDYIEACKKRIENAVFEMLPRYDDFSHKELSYFFKTQKKGFENLFKIDGINGNFNTYILFVQNLKEKLKHWEESLKRAAENAEVYDIDEDFNKAEEKISRLQKKKILSFFLLRNIRKKLIENAILSIPVEKYLVSLVQQNLAKSLLKYWMELSKTENSPIAECEKVLHNLKNLSERFAEKEKYLLEKIEFIENMNSSYYILTMFENQDDYTKLLKRIKGRNFGSHKTQLIKDTISNVIKLWVSEKDIFGITQNPTEFINFIENKFIAENKSIFSDTEDKIEEFYAFSKKAVAETQYKTENINKISFETNGTSLFQNETMLVPEKMKLDALSEEINQKFTESLSKVEVPKDFTLGSVVYFKDYLYMSQKDMKKKEFLENYKEIETQKPEYDNELSEKIVIRGFEETKNEVGAETENTDKQSEVLQDFWKFTRSLLLFYMDNEEVVSLYNKTFNTENDSVSEQEIENLSMAVHFVDVLHLLSEEKLTQFAKENNIPVKSDTEKQIKIIAHEFSKR